MAENGSPEKKPAQGEENSLARQIKIFLACMAGGMALGLAIIVVRRSLVPGPELPPRPRGQIPTAMEGLPILYKFLPLGGIPFKIKVWGRSPVNFVGDSEGAESLVEKIEREISSWRSESTVSRLNAARAGEAVPLGEYAFGVLREAFKAAARTRRAFNPVLGSAVALWREGERRGRRPSEDELRELEPLCSVDAFTLHKGKKVCRKNTEGARLDLGGIGKGYIVDRVVEFLRKRGLFSGVVSCGWDLRVFGPVSRKVFLPHPDRKGILYGYFYLRGAASATTVATERMWRIGGARYVRILDPATLRPVENPSLSVTVTAADCATADAFATALYVLGVEKGFDLVETIPDLEALALVRGKEGGIRRIRSKGFPEITDVSDQEQPLED